MNAEHRAAVVAVEQLYATYCFAIDSLDIAGFVDTFEAEGRFEIVGGRTLTGATDLREMAARRAGQVLHIVSNVLVAEPDLTSAHSVLASAYVTMVSRPLAAPVAYGFYDDVINLSGTAPRWRHKKLTYVTATPEYADAVGVDHLELPLGYRPIALPTSVPETA